MNAVFVFLGGGVGSLLRYSAYKLIALFSLPSWSATLLVNVLGSLVIVGLSKMISALPEAQQAFLRVGLLGGLTTFSTFLLRYLILSKVDLTPLPLQFFY